MSLLDSEILELARTYENAGKYQRYADELKKRGILENLSKVLSTSFALPRPPGSHRLRLFLRGNTQSARWKYLGVRWYGGWERILTAGEVHNFAFS